MGVEGDIWGERERKKRRNKEGREDGHAQGVSSSV